MDESVWLPVSGDAPRIFAVGIPAKFSPQWSAFNIGNYCLDYAQGSSLERRNPAWVATIDDSDHCALPTMPCSPTKVIEVLRLALVALKALPEANGGCRESKAGL